MIAEETVII